MRKFLKSTMALVLAGALLTGNTGYAQAVQEQPVQGQPTDTITKSVVSENAFASQTVGKQQSKAVVQAKSKKSTNAAYNKKAKKAYKKFLKGYFEKGKAFTYNEHKYRWSDDNSEEYSNRPYSIYDINHDGKLELLICNDGRPEYYLFTYYKNKVKCLDAPGYPHIFYECKKGKIIVDNEMHGGSEANSLCILQNGKLKCIGSILVNSEYAGGGVMKNGKLIDEWSFSDGNGKKISKAQFKKILKKYTGSTNIKAFVGCYKGVKKVKTQLKDIKYKTYKMPKA